MAPEVYVPRDLNILPQADLDEIRIREIIESMESVPGVLLAAGQFEKEGILGEEFSLREANISGVKIEDNDVFIQYTVPYSPQIEVPAEYPDAKLHINWPPRSRFAQLYRDEECWGRVIAAYVEPFDPDNTFSKKFPPMVTLYFRLSENKGGKGVSDTKLKNLRHIFRDHCEMKTGYKVTLQAMRVTTVALILATLGSLCAREDVIPRVEEKIREMFVK